MAAQNNDMPLYQTRHLVVIRSLRSRIVRVLSIPLLGKLLYRHHQKGGNTKELHNCYFLLVDCDASDAGLVLSIDEVYFLHYTERHRNGKFK